MTISFSSSAALLQWSEGLRYLLYMNIFITFFTFVVLFLNGVWGCLYTPLSVLKLCLSKTAGLQRSCKELYFIMYISITHIL